MTGRIDPNGEKLRLIRELAPLAGARVLDIGCGSGAASLLVAQHAATVMGIDPDASAIAQATAATPDVDRERVRFRAAHVGTVELPVADFDVVVFMRSL